MSQKGAYMPNNKHGPSAESAGMFSSRNYWELATLIPEGESKIGYIHLRHEMLKEEKG